MKHFASLILCFTFVASVFAQNAGHDSTCEYRVAVRVESEVPKHSPIVARVDFRELLEDPATVVDRTSIQVLANETSLPRSVSGDPENRGTATIAWRSNGIDRHDYVVLFTVGTVPNYATKIPQAGPIGIGDTFHYNHGKPGPANISPLHSQFLHLDWDGDGLRDLIGWGYRLFEHGEELEQRLGNAVYFLKNIGTETIPLFAPRRRMTDHTGTYLRSDLLPQNWFSDDWDGDGNPDFYAFGPASWLIWWENTGERDANGLWKLKPAAQITQFREASEFRERTPGILRKTSVWAPRGVRRVDWEGDGDVDLIVGYRKVSRLRIVDTSRGVAPYGTAIMVFDLLKNLGAADDGTINYARPVTLKDQTGIPIHGRGHANGSVEYADWDNDGDFDLLFHSETDRPLEGGRLTFAENRGTRSEPLFEAPIPIGVNIVDSPFLVDWNNDERLDMISNGELFENINPDSNVRHSLSGADSIKPIRGQTETGTRLNKISTYPKLVSRGIAKQIDPEILSYFTISVDWENDGDLDLLGGYHTGVRLFRNQGTTLRPIFDPPVTLEADGEPISMPNWLDPQSEEPSTYGPQGPTEPIYGWLCPTIGDWDRDGDLDLFVTGQRWETKYFENKGTRENPELARGVTVTVDGLTDLLSWRSKVSVGDIDDDGSMDLVIHSDRDNTFHVCTPSKDQLDPKRFDFNLGPALTLENGDSVKGWFGGQNNNGDNHSLLVDWDADGDLDFINGTLWAIYYYENVGTPQRPRFKSHGKFQLNGQDLHVFNHAGSFDAADWNDDGQLDLVLGTEGPSDQPHGVVLHLFDRNYLEGRLPQISIGKCEKTR